MTNRIRLITDDIMDEIRERERTADPKGFHRRQLRQRHPDLADELHRAAREARVLRSLRLRLHRSRVPCPLVVFVPPPPSPHDS